MPEPQACQDIGFLVKQIHDALERTINRELEAFQLTNSQLTVLNFLQFRANAETTIRDVQEYMNISHPTAAGLVKRLEQKGFVHLLVDPHDRRARMIRLNPLVREKFTADTRPTTGLEEKLMSGLGPQEREQLRNLLLRVYQNIR